MGLMILRCHRAPSLELNLGFDEFSAHDVESLRAGGGLRSFPVAARAREFSGVIRKDILARV